MAGPVVTHLSSEEGSEVFGGSFSEASSRSSSFDRQLSQHVASTVSVKNTFIDDFVDDSDEGAEDELPMVAARSCPVVRMPVRASLWGAPPAEAAPADLAPVPEAAAAEELGWHQGFLVQYLLAGRGPAQGADAATARPHELPARRCDALLVPHEQHPPVPQRPSAGSQVAVREAAAVARGAAAPAETSASCVVPLAVRQPEMSEGALLHAAGQCKPCAWFWRPQGCENGAECRHCHLCDAGAVKARRKAKVATLRTRGARERRAALDTKLA